MLQENKVNSHSFQVDNILAFGDSYPAGINKFDVIFNSNTQQNKINFVTELKELIGASKAHNYSGYKKNNLAISYDVFKALKNYKEIDSTLVLITWTGLFGNTHWDLESETFIPFDSKLELDYKRELYINFATISKTVHFLDNLKVKYLMTSSFLDYQNTQELKNILTPFADNWMDWGYSNNTLLDLINETYSREYDYNLDSIRKNDLFHYPSLTDYCTVCSHPNQEGHKLIAKHLANYLNTNYGS